MFSPKRYLSISLALVGLSVGLLGIASVAQASPSLTSGSLIKGESSSSVYYYANGKRFVFPNERVFKTWYADFSTVLTLSDQELASIALGGNVTYRPGMRMVKIQSSPLVYVVSRGSVLHWVSSEAVATALYGADWNKNIDDIPDTAFTDYTKGQEIRSAANYSTNIQMASATTIAADKNLLTDCADAALLPSMGTGASVCPFSLTVNTLSDSYQRFPVTLRTTLDSGTFPVGGSLVIGESTASIANGRTLQTCQTASCEVTVTPEPGTHNYIAIVKDQSGAIIAWKYWIAVTTGSEPVAM